jgi:GntR family transcriptional regulator / MocR family aminotransferase
LFIAEGHLERHIFALKKVYKTRRALLKNELLKAFGPEISLLGDEAGMHLLVRFQSHRLAELPWEHAADFGFRGEPAHENGGEGDYRAEIVLGYGNLTEEKISEGVRRMHAFAEAGVR